MPSPIAGCPREFICSSAHASELSSRNKKEPVNCFLGFHSSNPREILADSAPFLAERPSDKPIITRSKNFNRSSDNFDAPRIASNSSRIPKGSKSSSHDLGYSISSSLVFTPAQVYPIATSRSTTFLSRKRAISSPQFLDFQPSPPPYSKHAYHLPPPSFPMNSDTEDDRDEDEMIFTSRNGPGPRQHPGLSLRSRIFGLASASGPPRPRDKPICTTPGELCAGETETETDEPSRHLPTARIIHSSGPLVPPNTLQQRLTPLLFEFSRLLSIVPAFVGLLYSLYYIYHPPENTLPASRPPPERVDYFISALWTILTGYQCLALTTGLLTRWRLYYPPLSTLVRLLALQGICWPATHLTLTILEHEKRPALVWAVIGTTTCMSRSVQIWVTSNLWWERRDGKDHNHPHPHPEGVHINGTTTPTLASSSSMNHLTSLATLTSLTNLSPSHVQAISATTTEENRRGYWKRWGGGKWGGRRWDWREVGVKCVLPAGVVYFVMAWAEQIRREWAIAAGRC